MNLEQAIKTAMEYETRVRDAYRQAADKAKDPIGQKVFGALADEEQGHLDYLTAKLEQWTESGKVTPDKMDTAIPKPEAIQAQLSKLGADKEKRAPDTDELALLDQALKLEQETSDFYKRMVDELPAQDRAMFERFEEIEQGHVAIVQAELDNLRGLGYWFDYQEFDLQQG